MNFQRNNTDMVLMSRFYGIPGNRLLQLVIAVIGLWMVSLFSLHAQPYMVDRVVAIVGSKPLKLSELESQYLQSSLQGGVANPDMRCVILEQMLEQKLLVNQAEIDSIEVTNSEIQRTIDERISNLANYYGSESDIERLAGRSLLELREDWYPAIRDQLLSERLQMSVVQDVKMAPSGVRRYYNQLENDSIPIIPEQVEVAQIVLNAPHKEEAILEARQILLDCRKRIVDGESFRSLAILYSDEPAAVQTGGDIGFISRNQPGLDPDFARMAFTLKNVNDVSRIVETKFGLHLIQLLEKRGDQIRVRHILKKPKLDIEIVEKVLLQLDSIAGMIRLDSFTFEEGARYISHDEQSRYNGGLMVNPETGGTRFQIAELSDEDRSAIAGLGVGDISKPYQAVDERGNAVFKIAMLKNRIQEHRANLNQDYEYLLQLATMSKRQDYYDEWLKEKIRKTYILIHEPYRQCAFKEQTWLR